MNPPIIVTGCQRSGTTIAAHALGHDFNLPVVEDYLIKDHHFQPDTVYQCPLALHSYYAIYYANPNTHFVGVQRDPKDIYKSMKRIKWCQNDYQDWESFLKTHILHCMRLWECLKADIPPSNWTEIQYEALKDHPLWVEKRKKFTSKQWQPDTPVGPKYWKSNQIGLKELTKTL